MLVDDVLTPGTSDNTNETDSLGSDLKWSQEFSVLLATINIIVAGCIVFGNIMVLLVIVRHRGMRTRTNLFLVNLAIADLFVGVFAMPFSITTLLKHTWIFGDKVCLFNGWMNSFCLISSIHTLMYISIHKYFSIARPLSNPLTLRYILAMMVAAWFWAGVCSTMNITGLKVTYKPGTSQCGPNYPNDPLTYFIHVVIQITDLIIPFIILIFCYTRIFQEIRKLSKRLRAHSSAEDQDIIAQEKGVTVTMLIVLATFVIMALPYLAYANYTTIRRDKKHFSGYLNPVAYTFLYMSSMCNPIIYAFRSAAFREGYKEILCQKANYVTDEEANNTQRTNRLMSVISILRRGSLPANQNIVHRNGDIVITRGDRIVCVRRANAGVRSPGNGISPIPEHLEETNEDAEEDTSNAEAQSDNETFRLLKANIEHESLSDEAPYKSSSVHRRGNGTKSKNNSTKERTDPQSPVETALLSQEHCEVNDDVCSTLHLGAQSDYSDNCELFDQTPYDAQVNRFKESDNVFEKQKGEIHSNKNIESRPSSDGFFTKNLKPGVSKSRDFLDTSPRQQGEAKKTSRRLSKSSEDLQRPPTFVRLPSLEFLDPPVQIFRPRSNTTSLEKIAMLKAKFKGHSSDKTHTSAPRPRSEIFESASDYV